MDLRVHEAQPYYREKENGLPFEKLRRRQIAPQPTVNTQINEWRERPDVIAARSEPAHLAGQKAAKHQERQSGPLAVQQCRKTQQRTAQNSGETASDHSQQDCGLE